MFKMSRVAPAVFTSTLLLLLTAASVLATVPYDPPFNRTWSRSEGIRRLPRGAMQDIPRRDWDNYMFKYRRACGFLASMQEGDPESEDYGGMHEGEGDDLWRIVETDNTQEAIRVWSDYGRIFDDPDAYQDNIDAAWEYCDNFPAWEEEPLYYALHNCGWGLMAELAFRNTYETDEQSDYADECIAAILERTPEIDPDGEDRLMPLVVGWVAGTLALYGEDVHDEELTDAAISYARNVKDWIDADPDRLNNNEVWALCGGTAFWGVMTALEDDLTFWWGAEVSEHMDVFAGDGQWNNSWNIWYAHAWQRLWFRGAAIANAAAIVDSLLEQDGDGDGGIPATGGDGDDRDQSWVTAYTAWMGLEGLWMNMPNVNVQLEALIAPNPARPYPTNVPLTFTFLVSDASRFAVWREEPLRVPFSLEGPFEYRTDLQLEGVEPIAVELDSQWTPADTGRYEFTALVDHEEDGDRSSDTLHFALQILPDGVFTLTSRNVSGDPVACRFDFYNLDLNPDTVFTSIQTDSATGHRAGRLMVGRYRVALTPQFPYSRQWIEEYEVQSRYRNWIRAEFPHPSVLLVNNDTDTSRVSYYEDALDAGEYTYFRWSAEEFGVVGDQLAGFHTVVYYTGSRETDLTPEDDREALTGLLEAGGRLFITGQNISDELADDPFLEEVLHCRHLTDDINKYSVDGVARDPVLDGVSMLLAGNRGAANQTSPAGVEPVGDGIACAVYRDAGDTTAAVRWRTDSGGRGVFFAFGFEAVSGMGNTTGRSELMQRVLDYLGTPQTAPGKVERPLPQLVGLTVYPNPANGAVTFKFAAPLSRDSQLELFDLNGRLVERLQVQQGNGAVTWSNLSVPSGIYWVRYGGGSGPAVISGRFVLLR